MSSPRLLYYCPATHGGLADYARAQANALEELGVQVEMLVSEGFRTESSDRFSVRWQLRSRVLRTSALARKVDAATTILENYRRLATVAKLGGYRHVLLGAYAEYLAPLWSGRLFELSRAGVVFGAIVHDPVRDFVLGPRWWHARSVAAAYSFLSEAFVHEPIGLDTVCAVPGLTTTVIPHGPMVFPAATKSSLEVREELGLPPGAEVWLSFGHVRDGKNLAMIISALVDRPNACLVVAGKEQSAGQLPVAHYQRLAEAHGVSRRCFWLNRYIAPEEVGNLFAASDLVLLTYSRDFRSASGVLNVAVNFRRPVLVSSGQGNLKTMVERYGLGLWLEPDDFAALQMGLGLWRGSATRPRWDDYLRENSWERNAQLVRGRLFP